MTLHANMLGVWSVVDQVSLYWDITPGKHLKGEHCGGRDSRYVRTSFLMHLKLSMGKQTKNQTLPRHLTLNIDPATWTF